MKLYTEEQVNIMLNRARLHKQDDSEMFSNEYLLSAETPIELPSDEEIYWNDNKPDHIDNYIVHRGSQGVSLGWWNGEEWIEMWGSKKIKVNGWIKIPNTPTKWIKNKIQWNIE